MATRPTLHVAVEKTKNTASDYNDNFDMMMDFIDDSIGEAKDYVDDFTTETKNYVDGFMPSVTGQNGKFLTNDGTNTSWSNSFSGTFNFTGTVKVPNSATVGTAVATAAISKTATANTSGYVKFGNGIILQWLKFTQNTDIANHTWSTAFTSGTSYVTVITQISNGEEQNIAVTAQTATRFTCDAEYQERKDGLYAIAIGY